MGAAALFCCLPACTHRWFAEFSFRSSLLLFREKLQITLYGRNGRELLLMQFFLVVIWMDDDDGKGFSGAVQARWMDRRRVFVIALVISRWWFLSVSSPGSVRTFLAENWLTGHIFKGDSVGVPESTSQVQSLLPRNTRDEILLRWCLHYGNGVLSEHLGSFLNNENVDDDDDCDVDLLVIIKTIVRRWGEECSIVFDVVEGGELRVDSALSCEQYSSYYYNNFCSREEGWGGWILRSLGSIIIAAEIILPYSSSSHPSLS